MIVKIVIRTVNPSMILLWSLTINRCLVSQTQTTADTLNHWEQRWYLQPNRCRNAYLRVGCAHTRPQLDSTRLDWELACVTSPSNGSTHAPSPSHCAYYSKCACNRICASPTKKRVYPVAPLSFAPRCARMNWHNPSSHRHRRRWMAKLNRKQFKRPLHLPNLTHRRPLRHRLGHVQTFAVAAIRSITISHVRIS